MSDDNNKYVSERLEALRKRLIDLSNRNPLLNFRHSERSQTHIRIIDELPDVIFKRIPKGLTFRALPEPKGFVIDVLDERTEEFLFHYSEAKITDQQYQEELKKIEERDNSDIDYYIIDRRLRDRVREKLGMGPLPRSSRPTNVDLANYADIDPSYELPRPSDDGNQEKKHEDSFVQTLLRRSELRPKLEKLNRNIMGDLNETGVNTFYAAFGFLRWYATESSDRPLYAPLMLLQIDPLERKVDKRTGGEVRFKMTGDGGLPERNLVLIEKLKSDFGLELPEIAEEETPESYFKKVEKVISKMKNWKIQRYVTIGRFSFTGFHMYHDLDSDNWDEVGGLENRDAIRKLIYGMEENTETTAEHDAPEYDIDENPDVQQLAPILVMDADSSQHSAIVDVMKGENVAIKGPPGTGKSQTIVNIIANALYKGQKVLFVAEKKAALDVVYDRMKEIGLDEFCLPLHSAKTTVADLRDDLRLARDRRMLPEGGSLKRKIKEKTALREYADSITAKFGKMDNTIFKQIWIYQGLREIENSLPLALKRMKIGNVQNITPAMFEQYMDDLWSIEELDRKARKFECEAHPWYGVNATKESDDAAFLLKDQFEQCQEVIESIEDVQSELKNTFSWEFGDTLSQVLKKSIQTFRLIKYCSKIRDYDTLHAVLSESKLRVFPLQKLVNWIVRYPVNIAVKRELKSLGLIAYFESCGNVEKVEGDLSALIDLISRMQTKSKQLENLLESIWSSAEINTMQYLGVSDYRSIEFDKFRIRLERSLDEPNELDNRMRLLTIERDAKANGAHYEKMLRYIKSEDMTYANAGKIFKFLYYRNMCEKAIQKNTPLMPDDVRHKDNLQSKFREADKEQKKQSSQRVIGKLRKGIPKGGIAGGRVKDHTEMGLINHHVDNERARPIPIRNLLSRAKDALQCLTPCFLMSPMSVAKYIDPEGMKFDLVVIDEASQMPLEDAVGALARAKQVVVVGDQKQLPPTRYFKRQQETDSDYDIEEDDEGASVLDGALVKFRPTRNLRWHYRSKQESLIAFSNKQFYGNKLIVHPSPQERSEKFGLSSVYVGGTYNAGCNAMEVEVIANAARKHMYETPGKSLGIATMNIRQRQLIEERMDMLFAQDENCEEYRRSWSNELEPFFVKNLENVQGDERDVILVSTVYGPDNNGKVMQRFGPINGKHGHRRLNVLFTRAKYRLVLFTSLKPDDIRVGDGSAEGLKAFQGILKYAVTGVLEGGEETQREAGSEYEVQVAEELNNRGYDTTLQVGVAGYFIDIGVKHPDWPYGYILGVEFDGATYHSLRSVRDNDRLRQEVLESHGWVIHRIWSNDWFHNYEKEMKRLVKKIEGTYKWKKRNLESSEMEEYSEECDRYGEDHDDSKAGENDVDSDGGSEDDGRYGDSEDDGRYGDSGDDDDGDESDDGDQDK